jgi:hypothetical protein
MPWLELTSVAALPAGTVLSANGSIGPVQNRFYGGVLCFCNVTAVTGTSPDLDFEFHVYDPESGLTALLGANKASISVPGFYRLVLFPNATATSADLAINHPLPHWWQLFWTVKPACTFTLSLSYQYVV